jgi:hypothetical protein
MKGIIYKPLFFFNVIANLHFFFLSLDNVGLKFKYQFDDIIAAGNLKKHKNSEVDEPVSKKMKLNDNKITTILEYSSVQLPVSPFIDYLEKYSNAFVNQCLKYSNNSHKTTD